MKKVWTFTAYAALVASLALGLAVTAHGANIASLAVSYGAL